MHASCTPSEWRWTMSPVGNLRLISSRFNSNFTISSCPPHMVVSNEILCPKCWDSYPLIPTATVPLFYAPAPLPTSALLGHIRNYREWANRAEKELGPGGRKFALTFLAVVPFHFSLFHFLLGASTQLPSPRVGSGVLGYYWCVAAGANLG